MLWWGGVALGVSSLAHSGARRGSLGATFIQPLERHRQWRDEDWTGLFAAFTALGLTELIVQWSVHDRSSLFNGAAHATASAAPPVVRLLEHAERAGMSVLLGLAYDPAYWNEEARSADRLSALFDTLFSRSVATAGALLPLVARHRAVTGWYVCQEVDDLSWDAGRRPQLFAYLARITETLRRLAPGKRIALSGFTDARSTPSAVEAFWQELLARAPNLDRVLFQDGVGAGKLDLRELDGYLGAAARATRAAGRQFSVVIETFSQVSPPPGDKTPFSATPAHLARLLDQIRIASSHTDSLVAFSVPEYMSPQGGTAAEALYRDYLAQLADPRAR